MRLHSIKLSGFKSFADTTTVLFPSQMVGIVGPNGSGKSNIIDAIRLVLGERSAREIRGSQLKDVIFNGSHTRRMANLARIEMRFENAYAKLKGDYARFNEITIARQIDTEGQSSYYLNAVRTRRRDITDAFLGTGLGPRSYAIIQQGTISALVEAKPEELRNHLEEVAGISLYRDRRRETEIRLKNTSENLSRLHDTIEEITKRLKKLEKQAENAKKYRHIKKQRDQLHNLLIVMRWRTYQKRIDVLHAQKQNFVAKVTQYTHQEQVITAKHAQEQTQVDTLRNQIEQQQQKFYESKQAAALIEQQIHAQESRYQDITQELTHSLEQRERLQKQLHANTQQKHELDTRITTLKQDNALQIDTSKKLAKDCSDIEKTFASLSTDFQKAQHASYELQKKLAVLRFSIHERENNIDTLQATIATLTQTNDKVKTNTHTLESQITHQQRISQQHQQSLAECQQYIQRLQQSINQSEQKYKDTRTKLHNLERDIQKFEGRRESLHTLIANKTNVHNQQKLSDAKIQSLELTPWLPLLKVKKGWENAVENACGELLRSYKAPSMDSIRQAITQSTYIDIRIGIENSAPTSPPLQKDLLSVRDIIEGPLPRWMHSVWFASSLEDALEYWNWLPISDRIVTKDGYVLAKDWIASGQLPQGETLVGLQQQLHRCNEKIQHYTTQQESLRMLHHTQEKDLAALREDLEKQQEKQNTHRHELLHTNTQIDKHTLELQTMCDVEKKRIQSLQEAKIKAHNAHETLIELRKECHQLVQQQQTHQQSQGDLQDRYRFTESSVRTARAAVQKQTQTLQHSELALSKAMTQSDFVQKNLEEAQNNIQELDRRITDNKHLLKELSDKPRKLQNDLATQVDYMQNHEKLLTSLRQKRSTIEHQVAIYTKELSATRAAITQQNECMQTIAVEHAELVTRQDNLLEQLIDARFSQLHAQYTQNIALVQDQSATHISSSQPDAPNYFSHLDREIFSLHISKVQEKHKKFDNAITSLGEINHAAIHDYQSEYERKQELDEQQQQINKAKKTLEDAIATIDKETRQLFHKTFTQVNEHFNRIFVDMMRGGEARLELTSTDILNSGVQIIAQPPGKKNTSIAMLSGGEKAMTAISLVLALFSLNPAPFCVLDEVDAPLDDQNLVKFVQTIRHISSTVQFVVISHNKITMEHMDSLLGVTMNEPGVSRIVSVDIATALTLAQ